MTAEPFGPQAWFRTTQVAGCLLPVHAGLHELLSLLAVRRATKALVVRLAPAFSLPLREFRRRAGSRRSLLGENLGA